MSFIDEKTDAWRRPRVRFALVEELREVVLGDELKL